MENQLSSKKNKVTEKKMQKNKLLFKKAVGFCFHASVDAADDKFKVVAMSLPVTMNLYWLTHWSIYKHVQ